MKRLFLLLAFVFTFFTTARIVLAAPTRIDLGTADSFAVLGGSAISNTPTSVISGDVGLSPTAGTGITGLTTAEVSGTIYAVDSTGPAGSAGNNPALLTTAKNDLTTAYNDAAGRTTTSTIATELGGTTLTSGVYDSAAGTFGITGTLTLNGQGNADAVFIFKMASTLITASSSSVVLTNGAQACNVYWQVGSSATLGTSTSLIGNVLALTSITDNGSSTVNGRLLARNAAVTLNNTTITKSTCAAGTAGAPTPYSAPPVSSSVPGAPYRYCPSLNSQIVAPSVITTRRVDADSIFISWGPYSGTDKFNVRYGTTNGQWLYNVDVTGFSTTINNLPLNQSIWVSIAARNDCLLGDYGPAKFAGGPMLPNTGFSLQCTQINLPSRLIIPSINVNTNVERVGTNSQGVMDVPQSALNVGWYSQGPHPGELGSAVIAGHFNDKEGKAGVFADLYKLKVGDKLYVENTNNKTVEFVVSGSRAFDPGFADEVFGNSDGTHLNLVTCDGTWDEIKNSYSKRLVVFADVVR